MFELDTGIALFAICLFTVSVSSAVLIEKWCQAKDRNDYDRAQRIAALEWSAQMIAAKVEG